MAEGDIQVQQAVHALEHGFLAPVVRNAMITATVIALVLLYLFVKFAGLSNPQAMDQAQIARNIATGHGFTTLNVAPAAISLLEQNGKEIPTGNFPDFYQSPLSPWVTSFALGMVKNSLDMTATDLVYRGDRVVAALGISLFLLSLVVWFFVGRLLFDTALALFSCGILLVTDMMWQFSLSGLPQMLLLLLFSLVIFCTLRAMAAWEGERLLASLIWLFVGGIGFGLMALTHGLCLWLFVGWVAFIFWYFRPFLHMGLVAMAAFVLVASPWLVRNYNVCGKPFGLAGYTLFLPAGDDSPPFLHSNDLAATMATNTATITSKVREGVGFQVDQIFAMLGTNIAAAAFFFSLLHAFRVHRAAVFRWCVLAMWVPAIIGMAIFGVDKVISANQLHVIFLPLFVIYGAAFIMVLWGRLEIFAPLLRNLFLAFILFLCARPMVFNLIANRGASIQWPPYIPPYIHLVGSWFDKNEIIASDMSWAMAWYGDRKSLLLPESIKAFNKINDYHILGGPVSGLYLTPISGNQPLFGGIYKGAYKEWAGLITRPPRVQGFALPAYTPLPIEGECIIFADHDRWTKMAGGH